MRLLLLPVLCGMLAGLTHAQGFRGGAYGRTRIHVPIRSTTFGAPQLPPGTAINGVPGMQNSASLNGLPLFSNRTYQFGCLDCGPQRRRGFAAYPPFVGFVPLYDSYAFPTSVSDPDFGASPPPDPATLALADEINKLRGDINQLKDQAQAPAAPPAPAAAPAPSEPPPPATIIVMRDGRQIETTNYAVMDQTLWNFSARPVQKIPLSSIDVAASEKANSDRGVDFGLSADATK
jgi:hypothetical protein